MATWLSPTTLESNEVCLIPFHLSHRENLLSAAADGNLWELFFTSVPSIKDIDAYLDKIVRETKSGHCLAFSVFHKADNKIIGSTRYCNIDSDNKRLEIGYTWYGLSYQKTRVNTECKILLLEYAFEQLNCIAVELRTHGENHNSQRAIERLGAKKDGVLRHHKYDKVGNLRDTVVYSILAQEWLSIKQNLKSKLIR